MEQIFYSWLGASASAPLVMVLALWTTFVFHTYRLCWRTVDLFLLALTTQEFLSALFAFGFSVISLISPRLETPCEFVLWGLTTVRVFQVFTLASLLVDRVLTIRWPYRYRFSVRRNHIRYHIAVMSIVAVFVGIAGVFARSPPVQVRNVKNVDDLQITQKAVCSLQPLHWDIRFSIFLLSLYAVLTVTIFLCFANIEMHWCQTWSSCQEFQMAATSGSRGAESSGSMTSSTGSSAHPLHYGSSQSRQDSRRPYGPERRLPEFRWAVVAAVLLLCSIINHLPYQTLFVLSLSASYWSHWQDNIVIWLCLAEGFCLPLVLYMVDPKHRGAVKKCFQRKRGSLSGFAGSHERRFSLFFEDLPEKTPGSSPFSAMAVMTNYKRTSSRKGSSKRVPLASSSRKRPSLWNTQYILPSMFGIDPILNKSPTTATLCKNDNDVTDMKETEFFQTYTETDSLKYSLEDSDSHIYATLSDTVSSYSFRSGFMDESPGICLNGSDVDDDAYDGSFTTLANDDFEFHDTRPCGGEVRMRPSMPPLSNEYDGNRSFIIRSSAKNGGGKQQLLSDSKCERSSLISNTSTSSVQDLILHICGEKNKAGFDNPSFEGELEFEVESSRNHRQREALPFHVYRINANDIRNGAQLHRTKPTSLSMNDLEMIGTDSSTKCRRPKMPAKSESMLALHKPDDGDVSSPRQHHLPALNEQRNNATATVTSDWEPSSFANRHPSSQDWCCHLDVYRDSSAKIAPKTTWSKQWRSNQDIEAAQRVVTSKSESNVGNVEVNQKSPETCKTNPPFANIALRRQFFSDLHLPSSTCKYLHPCANPDCCKLIISEVL